MHNYHADNWTTTQTRLFHSAVRLDRTNAPLGVMVLIIELIGPHRVPTAWKHYPASVYSLRLSQCIISSHTASICNACIVIGAATDLYPLIWQLLFL